MSEAPALTQPLGTEAKKLPFVDRHLHIDDFLDATHEVFGNPEWAYAHFLFNYWRKPAVEKMMYEPFMSQFKLFVDYEGETYRVTGASRLGDIWLTRDFNRRTGYDRRVDLVLSRFSNWRREADRALTWTERVRIGVRFYQMPVSVSFGIPKICNQHTSFLNKAGAPKQYLECTAEERTFLKTI